MRNATHVPLKWCLDSLRDGTHGTFQRISGGIPLLSAKNISSGRLLISDEESTISEQDYEAINRNGYLAPGDVLMSIVGSIGNVAFFDTDERVAFQRSVAVLRPKRGLHPRYLMYQLMSPDVQTQLACAVKLSAQGGVYLGDLGQVRVRLPSERQQAAVVRFLDAETGRVDALLSTKNRQLDLMAEKRKAIIATAVTRGLDSKVKLRDSGVPWLGEIPAHWEIESARWLFRERDVRSSTGDEEMLTVSHLTGVTPRSEKDVNMFEADTNEGYKLCGPGDLVINTLWAWMGAMGIAPVKGIVSPAYNVYEPGPRLAPAYIDALVRLPLFAQEVTRYSKGVWSSRLRLYPEGFFEVYLPVPPLEEQRAVVTHIARETAKLDAVRAATERTIALLRERRAALIAAAVTGQLDVGAAE